MAIQRKTSTALVDIALLKRREAGAWVDIGLPTRAFRREAGAWVDLLPTGTTGGLSATASTNYVSGAYNCIGTSCATVRSITSLPVVITATGGSGTGPTYSWTRVSGDSAISATASTSDTTQFTANVPRETEYTAVFRCTVTRGTDTVTVDVNVSISYAWGV